MIALTSATEKFDIALIVAEANLPIGTIIEFHIARKKFEIIWKRGTKMW